MNIKVGVSRKDLEMQSNFNTASAIGTKFLELSSVHIVYLDGDDMPAGGGSGGLFDYDGQRYLMTAFHVTDVPRAIRIELDLGWNPVQRKTMLRDPGTLLAAPTSLRLVSDDQVTSHLTDFAFYQVPYQDVPQRQVLDQSGAILSTNPIKIWSANALTAPKEGVEYGFAGHTMHDPKWDPTIAKDVHLLSTKFQIFYGLTFEKQVGEFYAFKLPFAHPGKSYFKGCSGAPILDLEGNIVAFVSHGRDGEDKIYGIPAERYRFMLDINVLLNQYATSGKPNLENYQPEGSWQ
jgi:hypothetical protein